MSMGAHPADEPPRHGLKCAPGLYAPHCQHFFNARLDNAVDGQRITVVEVDSRPDPVGPENPYGNAGASPPHRWRVNPKRYATSILDVPATGRSSIKSAATT